jgi:hypothetical protein
MMSLDKIKNVLNSAKDETARIVIKDENGLGYHIYDFSFSVSEDGVEEIIFKIFSDGGVC